MLLLIVCLLLVIALLIGIGRLASSLLDLKTENPWLLPWLGFFFVSTVSMAASCVVRLTIWGLISFSMIGLAGLLWGRRHTAENRLFPYTGQFTWAYWLLCFGFLVLLGSRLSFADWPGFAYDTDLYHANAVRWMNDYGTPPGLATVHTRLGFNSSWLVFAALLDHGMLDGRTAWIMPALPVAGAMFYLGYESLFGKNSTLRILALCLLPFIFLHGFRIYPSLYYDFPSIFFTVLVMMECIRLTNMPKKAVSRQALLITCMAATAFMIKPIGAVCVLFSSGWIVFILHKQSLLSIRNCIFIFALPAAAALIWMGKNALLSGYLLFPLPYGKLPLPWTVAKSSVTGNYEAIIGWARAPGKGYRNAVHGWDWLYPWLQRHLSIKIFWLYMLLCLGSLLLWLKAIYRYRSGEAAFFFVWSLCAIVYWFFTAPDLRFGNGFFEISFAAGAAYYFSGLIPNGTWLRPFALLAAVLFCMSATAYATKALRSPQKSLIAFSPIPSRSLHEKIIDNTTSPPIILYWPESGDQCGNSPLPCSPYSRMLNLRTPGDLAGGFLPR